MLVTDPWIPRGDTLVYDNFFLGLLACPVLGADPERLRPGFVGFSFAFMFILVFFECIRAVLVVFLRCICAVLVLLSCCSRALLVLFSCCPRALSRLFSSVLVCSRLFSSVLVCSRLFSLCVN
jgi:hypothetical protein